MFIPFIYGIISQFVSFHPVANECWLASIVLTFQALRGIKELELIVDSSLVTCSVGIPCVGSYSLKYLNIYILFFQIIASKKI